MIWTQLGHVGTHFYVVTTKFTGYIGNLFIYKLSFVLHILTIFSYLDPVIDLTVNKLIWD